MAFVVCSKPPCVHLDHQTNKSWRSGDFSHYCGFFFLGGSLAEGSQPFCELNSLLRSYLTLKSLYSRAHSCHSGLFCTCDSHGLVKLHFKNLIRSCGLFFPFRILISVLWKCFFSWVISHFFLGGRQLKMEKKRPNDSQNSKNNIFIGYLASQCWQQMIWIYAG